MVVLVRPSFLGERQGCGGPLDSHENVMPEISQVKVPENGEPGQIVRMLKLCVGCPFCDMSLPSENMMRTKLRLLSFKKCYTGFQSSIASNKMIC